jgi:hypothetical protein
MATATPLTPLRNPSDDPDIWRVSIRFLGDDEVPPNVISHGTVEASPAASLHDLVQGIEHEGCLTSAVHGFQITAYTSAPLSSCMTARPAARDPSRLEGSGPPVSAPMHWRHGRTGNTNLVCQHAASITETRLTVNQHQFLADFALHVHQRLMRSRDTGPPSLEYEEAAWLTTRAYIARSLEDLGRPRPVRSATTSSQAASAVPPAVDEADLA